MSVYGVSNHKKSQIKRFGKFDSETIEFYTLVNL
jgi:hypothetical protein